MQQEVRWAKESGKQIITVFEAESHRPGFFDFQKAQTKYHGTEFEFVLGIEAIPYQREAAETREMLAAIFKQAYGASHTVTQETQAQAKFCMGGVYENQRDLHSAANYYEQAGELFADTVGEEHEFTRVAREKFLSVT